MHNWLEGILEHHLRVLWGVGRDKAHEDKVKERADEALEEHWYESDTTETEQYDSEVEELREEAKRFEHFSSLTSTPSDADSTQTLPPRTSSSAGTPRAASPEGQDMDDMEDDTYVDIPHLHYDLPQAHLKAIRECIRNVKLPTWVGRPPANLGEASHGKLRANDFLVLFSFILPLIVPEFWHGPESSEVDGLHLRSFEDLVVCTNIVSSFKTSNHDAYLYTHLYTRYRRTIQMLFHWNSVPNHHFAMHNGRLLKFWGPLPALSEFPGERLIGDLQNINTNSKIGEISA